MIRAARGETSRDLVLVGVDGGQRATACVASLRSAGHRVRLLPYADLFDSDAAASAVARALSGGGARPLLVRLESPSDDPALDARLATAGGAPPVRVAEGALLPTRAWTRGLGRLLTRLDRLLTGSGAQRLYDTDSVLTMFDKRRTHALLRAGGVPVAPALDEQRDWSALRDAAERSGWRRLFVKSRFGSSGAGICAVRWQGARLAAYTTVGFGSTPAGRPSGPVNSRPRRIVEEAGITRVVEAIAASGGLHAELWVPKFRFGPGVVDLRVVVIAGRARHLLARVGPGPLTNLHLGSARGDVAALATRLGSARWATLVDTAEQAAGCLPRAHHCGVDVALDSAGRPFVLELNAFGDFHQGVRDADGLDTYSAEVALAGAAR